MVAQARAAVLAHPGQRVLVLGSYCNRAQLAAEFEAAAGARFSTRGARTSAAPSCRHRRSSGESSRRRSVVCGRLHALPAARPNLCGRTSTNVPRTWGPSVCGRWHCCCRPRRRSSWPLLRRASGPQRAAARRSIGGRRSAIPQRSFRFFQKPATQHDASIVSEIVARGRVVADAGADGLFAPGMIDLRPIAELAAASPLPLNIKWSDPALRLDDLAGADVSRISHGSYPYRAAMSVFEEVARNR